MIWTKGSSGVCGSIAARVSDNAPLSEANDFLHARIEIVRVTGGGGADICHRSLINFIKVVYK